MIHIEDKIIIPLHKHIAVLYPSEVQKLLLKDEELYIKAMQRGKSEKRYEANENRLDKRFALYAKDKEGEEQNE